MDSSQIREHMDVIGSDSQHVGTVDDLEGQRIKLTKSDPASGGQHHFIGIDKVASVDGDKVKLSCTAQEARAGWTTAAAGGMAT
jgi:hypothetical protein